MPSHAARPLALRADFRNGSDPLEAGRPGDTEGVLALVCGAVGGLLLPRFFDYLVVGASAVSGAAMVMTGANHILPGVGFFDRASGGMLPSLITIILAFAGVSWQLSNIAKWTQMLSLSHDVSNAPTKDQDGPPRP